MAVIVSLRDFIEEMDLVTDEATAYINRKTGELITLTDEILALAEDPDEAAEAPQWQKDLLPKAREVIGSEDFLPLPGNQQMRLFFQPFRIQVVGIRRASLILHTKKWSAWRRVHHHVCELRRAP